jgi:predicted enzyme related to lactoylglutathione lyase
VGDLAFFDCGGTRLFLSSEGKGGEQSCLYFTVPQIDAKYDELKGRGVEFVDAPHMIFTHPDGTEEWMAFFKDCDGQVLGLMSQVKA